MSDYKYQKKYKKTHPEYAKREKEKYYSKGKRGNGKQRWSEEDLQLILKHDITDEQLSETLGRSIMSIQVTRSRIKTGNDLPVYIAEMKLDYEEAENGLQ